MRGLVVLMMLVAACRGGGRPRGEARVVLPSIEARPRAIDDPIVAKVDGRPIYGSCVAAQAAALHEDRKRALDDCIGFELLAGAAAARGVTRDPDVKDGYRRALVSRYVDAEFTARVTTWDDLPADLRDTAFHKLAWRMHRPEYRFAVYVRAPLGDQATPADDAAARALIEQIYDRLKDREDLFPVDLYATADEVAGNRRVDKSGSPYGTGLDGPGDKTFTQPLFAIPAIGQVAPPARTKWGWDLILWVDTMPPLELSADELKQQLFPDLRRAYFDRWVQDVARAQHVEVVVDEDRVAALVPPDDQDDQTSPPPGAPR
jgi:hypothetical protein